MKEIELIQGKCALVDDEDYDSLNKVKWYAHKGGNTMYAVHNKTNRLRYDKQLYDVARLEI